MIWDNHFSDFSLTSGLLETHDEETEQYFENTKVKVSHCTYSNNYRVAVFLNCTYCFFIEETVIICTN